MAWRRTMAIAGVLTMVLAGPAWAGNAASKNTESWRDTVQGDAPREPRLDLRDRVDVKEDLKALRESVDAGTWDATRDARHEAGQQHTAAPEPHKTHEGTPHVHSRRGK